MIKIRRFRQINLWMERGRGYGQYYFCGFYKGKEVKVHTTDSEAWDWFDDDSLPHKQRDAIRSCYNAIKNI